MQSRPYELTLKESGRPVLPPARNHTIYKALCIMLAQIKGKFGIDLTLMPSDRYNSIKDALTRAGIRYDQDENGIKIEKPQ